MGIRSRFNRSYNGSRSFGIDNATPRWMWPWSGCRKPKSSGAMYMRYVLLDFTSTRYSSTVDSEEGRRATPGRVGREPYNQPGEVGFVL